MKRCNSCGRNTKDFAEFPCPECREKVTRCQYCRKNINPYTCKCGFVGP